MPVKLNMIGVFETSYRKMHKRAQRETLLSREVIISLRRAALVAKLKREQKGGK